MANRRDLVSAVANLVDNAIKYSEPGGAVYVDADRRGDRACLRVRDEGVGIPRRDQERIFERFYRVDRARRAGLVGPVSVWLSSGTWPHITAATFRLIRSKGRARLSRCGCLSPTRNTPVTEQVTVLLVEDEPSFVEALVVGLKREGFRVEVAYDGAEALDKFASVRPDLVLLDVMLPRVSGIDVCRTIRAAGSRTPIIMVTAKTSEIDTVVGLEVGADDYVSKPYRLRELVARMRAVLRRTPPPEEVPEESDVLDAGDLRLDPERHEVYLRGQEVSLPLKEFELLELLMTNAGRVLTRETLIDRVWGLTTWATPRPSMCTSNGCGRGSRTTRHTRGGSPRSAAWATSSKRGERAPSKQSRLVGRTSVHSGPRVQERPDLRVARPKGCEHFWPARPLASFQKNGGDGPPPVRTLSAI